MTNEQPSQPLFSLEDADLSTLLMPSWVKESPAKNVSKHEDRQDQKKDEGSSQRISKFSQQRRSKNNLNNRGKKERFSFSKKEDLKKERPASPDNMPLTGWKIEFLPEQRGLDEIAKRLKVEAKAYPLFELAKLILEKPERYLVRFVKNAAAQKNVSRLYQCRLDESLWLSEKELIAHVLKTARDRFYLTETIEVEPPKGAYTSIAVCGESIIGPSNHHEYQTKIRQLHAERFSHLPFEVFKNRIQMVRDEALIEQWKKEQTTREVFTTRPAQENESVEKFSTLAELETHFKKEHAASLIVDIENEVMLAGAAGMRLSALPIQKAAHQALENLKRFPLPLSHLLGEEFATRGLQIFKAHENIVYVSVARPRALNRQETPLSPPLAALIAALEAHAKSPRVEQWKAMVASRSLNEHETEAERESAVAKDLSWLIHEGYVMNYALRGFAIAKAQKVEAVEK